MHTADLTVLTQSSARHTLTQGWGRVACVTRLQLPSGAPTLIISDYVTHLQQGSGQSHSGGSGGGSRDSRLLIPLLPVFPAGPAYGALACTVRTAQAGVRALNASVPSYACNRVHPGKETAHTHWQGQAAHPNVCPSFSVTVGSADGHRGASLWLSHRGLGWQVPDFIIPNWKEAQQPSPQSPGKSKAGPMGSGEGLGEVGDSASQASQIQIPPIHCY